MRKLVAAVFALGLVACGHKPARLAQVNVALIDPALEVRALPSHGKYHEPDWRAIGSTQIALGDTAPCFFDNASVERMARNYIKSWVKCLPDVDMRSFGSSNNKDMLDRTNKKMSVGYVSPYAKSHMPTRLGSANDFIAYITMSEIIADYGEIIPQILFFVEIDCSAKLYRTLSVDAPKLGITVSDEAGGWKAISPDSSIRGLAIEQCST